jgi:hypothetical protein
MLTLMGEAPSDPGVCGRNVAAVVGPSVRLERPTCGRFKGKCIKYFEGGGSRDAKGSK